MLRLNFLQVARNGRFATWKRLNSNYINEKQLEGCQTLQSGDRILLSKESPEFIFECTSLPALVQ